MDEKNVLHKIKESANPVIIPDSLSPEKISKKLDTPLKKKLKFPVYKVASMAAVLLLFLVAALLVPRVIKSPEPAHTESGLETSALPGLTPVGSYEELYDAISTLQSNQTMTGDGVYSEAKESAAAETESAVAADASSSAYNGDFSQTNLQEIGVDESDVVKTDGSYLYILTSRGDLRIVKADKEQLTETGTIALPDLNETPLEFYLDGDNLMIIAQGTDASMELQTEASDMHSEAKVADYYALNRNQYTILYTYDISKKDAPVLNGSMKQEGFYHTSRKIGNYIYLFSEYHPVMQGAKEIDTYIPKVGDSRLATDELYLPKYVDNTGYLVISSVDITQPDKATDRKAVLSAAYLFYVSQENIYICNNNWTGVSTTSIMKFHFENGAIGAIAAGEIPGSLNNSFSLNEHKGDLRAVTTNWDGSVSQNALYVLDKDMKMIGKIEHLAPGETIQSARFMGDMGYFVTFRQVDPLFSVDLSVPSDPKILGELKVTGFSSYLHFYGENRLLGLGEEVDPDTGEYKGVKLSMFDISDPSNVKELHKYVIKNAYSYAGFSNYKAILADPVKNLIGFGYITDSQDAYQILSYDEAKGFASRMVYAPADAAYGSFIENAKGLYVQDTFYLTHQNPKDGVLVFDMTNGFVQKGKLIF